MVWGQEHGGRGKCLMLKEVQAGLSKKGLQVASTTGEELIGTVGNEARTLEAKMSNCEVEINRFLSGGEEHRSTRELLRNPYILKEG